MDPYPTDAEAIEESWNDPSRFTLVFERHFRALHNYLLRRVSRDLADDLAAETFLKAFESRSRYDLEKSDARPWLYGIAINMLRQSYRTERRQLRAFARTGVDPLEEGDLPAVIDRVDAARESARLAGALVTLSHREREVLMLSVWAELSYKQIAEALDLPLGTVQSRLFRARKRLRLHLDSRGPSSERETWAPMLTEKALEARGDENG